MEDPVFFPFQPNQSPIGVPNIGVTYPDPEYCVDRKTNDKYIFEFVLSGKGTVRTDATYEVKAGDLFLFRPGGPVYYRADRREPFQKYWLIADGALCGAILEAYRISDTVYRAADCRDIFDKLFAFAKSDMAYEAFCTYAVSGIHEICSRLFLRASDDKYPPYIKRAKQLLEQSLTSNTSLDEILQSVYVSKATLIRQFRAYFGQTPHQYLLLNKLNAAKIMLSTTRATVRQTAKYFGFADAYYFSNAFKKHFGISPSECKRKSDEPR